jgi:alkanesulfonate monooxygenase SsuD/methylene tetrahydromethanopterin reductase-like flavin-dependent oxidoreductase (luciferase family)
LVEVLAKEIGHRGVTVNSILPTVTERAGVYVAESTQEAIDDFYPGYARTMSEIGKERGWRKLTRAMFDSQRGLQDVLLVGDPDEVSEKIIRHSKALGISRITFMMNPASLPHEKLMQATKLIGTRIAPALREIGEQKVKVV